MGQPRPLFRLFSVFSNKHYIFTTNICEKCPSSIWCRDSNPRPFVHEPPITIGPGLLPNLTSFVYGEVSRDEGSCLFRSYGCLNILCKSVKECIRCCIILICFDTFFFNAAWCIISFLSFWRVIKISFGYGICCSHVMLKSVWPHWAYIDIQLSS